MNEKLIKLLELPEGATEEAILAAVTQLAAEAKAKAVTNGREKRIRAKIAESSGALNREQAIMAIDHQEEADAKRKGKK
jgi:phosphotransacetylase